MMANRYPRHFGGMSSQQLQLVVPLKRPESPGSTIKILKGVVPIQVAARRPEPLIVTLTDAIGKTFENSETSVVVHGIRKNPPQTQTILEMTIRSVGGAVPVFQAEPNGAADPVMSRPRPSPATDRSGRWPRDGSSPGSSRPSIRNRRE